MGNDTFQTLARLVLSLIDSGQIVESTSHTRPLNSARFHYQYIDPINVLRSAAQNVWLGEQVEAYTPPPLPRSNHSLSGLIEELRQMPDGTLVTKMERDLEENWRMAGEDAISQGMQANYVIRLVQPEVVKVTRK